MQLLDFSLVRGRCKLGRVGLGFGESSGLRPSHHAGKVVVARAKREGWPEIGGLLCLCGSGSHGPPLEGGAHTRARPPWNSPGPWLAWLACPNRCDAADGEIGCKCLEHFEGKNTSPAARLAGKRSHSTNMFQANCAGQQPCAGSTYPIHAMPEQGRKPPGACNTPSTQSSLVAPGQFLDCEGRTGDPCSMAPRQSLVNL
jgi:hypothetical protein